MRSSIRLAAWPPGRTDHTVRWWGRAATPFLFSVQLELPWIEGIHRTNYQILSGITPIITK